MLSTAVARRAMVPAVSRRILLGSSLAASYRSPLILSQRFQATTAPETPAQEKTEERKYTVPKEHPPGFRVNPDPKGTSFQINTLPIIYFVTFWAAVAVGVKLFFFPSEEKQEKQEKTANKA